MVNEGNLKKIDEKCKLIWLAQKTNDDDIIKKAHKHRNHVNRLVLNAKKNFYKERVDINFTNPKKLWNFINELVPCSKQNKKDDSIHLVDSSNNIISLEDMPNQVNSFFNKVGFDNNTHQQYSFCLRSFPRP